MMASEGVLDGLLNEITEARWLCGLVTAKWSSSKDVIWMQLGEINGDLPVVKNSQALDVVDDRIGGVLSKTICLRKVLERMLEIGRKVFNICDSLPKLANLTTDLKLPRAKTKWITSSSSKEAILSLVTTVTEEMWREETLIVHGFPLFDSICTKFLFLIAHLFDKVGLVRPHGSCTTFIFFGFHRLNRVFERILQNLKVSLRSGDPKELSILFSSASEDNLNKFIEISCIIECLCLKNRTSDILSNIEESARAGRKGKINLNSLEEAFSKLNCYDDQERCTSPECAKKRVNGSSKAKSVVTCQKVRNKIELYLCYSLGLNLENSKNSIWIDCPSDSIPALEMVCGQPISVFNEMEATKYCLGELLKCQQNLSGILRHFLRISEKEIWESSCLSTEIASVSTTIAKYPWSSSPLEIIVLDFGKELWMNFNKHKALQDGVLKRIIGALQELWKDECLELRGFPLLSDFNVSLVFVLCHLFDKVRLYHTHSGSNTVIFVRLKNNASKVEEVKRHLVATVEAGKLVRSLIPLKYIFGSLSGQFFEKIKNANNSSMKKQCIFMSNMLLNIQ